MKHVKKQVASVEKEKQVLYKQNEGNGSNHGDQMIVVGNFGVLLDRFLLLCTVCDLYPMLF